MPKLTIGQQCNRLFSFLMGMRDPSIARLMAEYGFDKEVLDEGWDRFRDVAGGRLAARPIGSLNAALIQDIDAWENRWFPICSAVLRRHFPAVHEQVFLNLTQTEGAEVVVSVGTLLDRLDALPAHDGKDGDDGEDILAMLAAHGMSAEVLAQGRALVARATVVAESAPTVDEEELALREQEMWSYYLQWSTIARSVIKDRRMLRRLGFLKSRPSRPGDDAGTEDGAGDGTGNENDDDLGVPVGDELDLGEDDALVDEVAAARTPAAG